MARHPHPLLIEEVRSLLQNNDLKVTVIASRLGYADPSSFTRFFVRALGPRHGLSGASTNDEWRQMAKIAPDPNQGARLIRRQVDASSALDLERLRDLIVSCGGAISHGPAQSLDLRERRLAVVPLSFFASATHASHVIESLSSALTEAGKALKAGTVVVIEDALPIGPRRRVTIRSRRANS